MRFFTPAPRCHSHKYLLFASAASRQLDETGGPSVLPPRPLVFRATPQLMPPPDFRRHAFRLPCFFHAATYTDMARVTISALRTFTPLMSLLLITDDDIYAAVTHIFALLPLYTRAMLAHMRQLRFRQRFLLSFFRFTLMIALCRRRFSPLRYFDYLHTLDILNTARVTPNTVYGMLLLLLFRFHARMLHIAPALFTTPC